MLLLSLPAWAQKKDEFKLVKKDGTTSIYERWINFPKTTIEAREVKGEFYFNNTIYEGLRLLQNESKIMQWQDHVSEFNVYKQTDTTAWYEYSYHDIPWPVSDQDHYLVYRMSSPSEGVLFITFESVVNDKVAPVRDGVTRMQLSGSWRYEQLEGGRTKVTYLIMSKPIGIPKFLTDPIIRSNIMTTIKGYVGLLEGKEAND
jgi:hypothetical protein